MKSILIVNDNKDYISNFLKESPCDIIKIIFIDCIYNIENDNTKSFLCISKEIRNLFFNNKDLLISLLCLNHSYWECKMINNEYFYINYYFKSIKDFYKQYLINTYYFFNNNKRKEWYKASFLELLYHSNIKDLNIIYCNINKHLSIFDKRIRISESPYTLFDYDQKELNKFEIGDRYEWKNVNDDAYVFEYKTCNCLTCIYRRTEYYDNYIQFIEYEIFKINNELLICNKYHI